MWEVDYKEGWALKIWCFWTVVLEKTLESLGLQGDPTSPSQRKSVLNIHWKDGCWSWSSNTLATWCEELTHLKRPWCWERLKLGEGDDREWESWMVSPTQWTWVWVNSGCWWWTGRPGALLSMGSQSQTQLSDWTELRRVNVIIPSSTWVGALIPAEFKGTICIIMYYVLLYMPCKRTRTLLYHCTAAAAAKSLQSCLTLCDPIDGSPPGSPVPGILQARTLEWVAISFSNAWKWKVKNESEVSQSCPTLSDPIGSCTIACLSSIPAFLCSLKSINYLMTYMRKDFEKE